MFSAGGILHFEIVESHNHQWMYLLQLNEVAKRELTHGVNTSSHVSTQLQVLRQNFQLHTQHAYTAV